MLHRGGALVTLSGPVDATVKPGQHLWVVAVVPELVRPAATLELGRG